MYKCLQREKSENKLPPFNETVHKMSHHAVKKCGIKKKKENSASPTDQLRTTTDSWEITIFTQRFFVV